MTPAAPLLVPPQGERVYTAGPYNSLNWSSTGQNIARAQEQAQRVRELGFIPVCPHVAVFPGTTDEESAMAECFSHLETCHALVMLDDAQFSEGSKREEAFARARGIVVFDSVDALAAMKADGLPVTNAGLVRLLWFHLAEVIARHQAAGMPAPAQIQGLWYRRFGGTFEVWLNAHEVPVQANHGPACPPAHLLIEHMGGWIATIGQGGFGIREDSQAKFRDFVKAVRDDARRGNVVTP